MSNKLNIDIKPAEKMKVDFVGNVELVTIKGAKGDKGDQGDVGLKGDIGEKGEQGIEGKVGKQGVKGEKGAKGEKGDNGKDGINGSNGLNGKDGSPDTGKDIVQKIEQLPKGERLNYDKLDNLPNINALVGQIKRSASAKTVSLSELDDVNLDGLTVTDGKYDLGSGGGTGGGHTIQEEGTSLPARTYLNFKGASVTATDNAGADSTDVTVSTAASTFLDLTDTPNSYSGQSGKAAVVNGTEDALIFTTISGTDEKVKYDASDPTAGYVADKVVAGTGISVAEGTGATENKLVVTNSAPDQTVSISAGTNITSVTGTYPNFTVNAATQTTDISGKLSLDQTSSQSIINGQPIQDTLTASQIVATDASKKLQTLAVATYPSLTELSYVKGVTSAIQTQLNAKGAGTVTSVASGNGMNFTTITGTGTVTMGTPSALTATSTDAVSTTSHTHSIDSTIARTSALASYLPLAGGTMTGSLNLVTGTTTVVPIKFTSGTLKTSGQAAGDVEFLTDAYYATITTGTARKVIALIDPVGGLTAGRMTFSTTNGRVTDSANAAYTATTGLTIIAGAATAVPIISKGAASQTADLSQCQDSSANVLSKVDVNGAGYFSSTGQSIIQTGMVVNQSLDATSASPFVVNGSTGTVIEVRPSIGQALGFYGVTPVVRPTALTTQLTTITATAPGTPDYAIADLTQTLPYGFASADEGQSVLKVIANLQTRVAELETKLQALGLLT
jgi:hypothetical protein